MTTTKSDLFFFRFLLPMSNRELSSNRDGWGPIGPHLSLLHGGEDEDRSLMNELMMLR
jgi:hypothetical protein